MVNVILYPCSTNELLDCDKFMKLLAGAIELMTSEEDVKCVRVILDKDDGSHHLPILVSFTRISDEERRLRSDIPEDAGLHVFVNKEELVKVKKYDAVEAVRDFIKFLRLMARFNNAIHNIL